MMESKPLPEASCPSSSRREFLVEGAVLAGGAGLGACHAAEASDQAGDTLAALDEQLAGLEDQRHSVLPISDDEREARRLRLSALLAERDLDAMIVEPGATMTYLSGVAWGHSERLFALVVLAGGESFWLCPAFEEERARGVTRGTGEVVTWEEHEYAYAPLASALATHRAQRLCFDPAIRYFHVDHLAHAVGAPPAAAAHQLLLELRGRKDEHELTLLRRANELTQEAIIAAHRLIRPGMTGDDLGAIVARAHARLGLTGHWDLSLFGPAAAKPHGEDRRRPLERGDMILVDTGGALHGYQSDNTRSWVFDTTPTQRQSAVWNAVRDAQRRAFEAIKPGARGADVDIAAREALEGWQLPSGGSPFTHRLGHGIGLEGHEAPYFDGGSEVTLASGMTLSNEPGLYFPGEFGVRIEDIVAVTETGATHFGSWQRDPRSPENA